MSFKKEWGERYGKELFVALGLGFYLKSLFIKMFYFMQAILLCPGCSLPPHPLHLLLSLLLFELKLFP